MIACYSIHLMVYNSIKTYDSNRDRSSIVAAVVDEMMDLGTLNSKEIKPVALSIVELYT